MIEFQYLDVKHKHSNSYKLSKFKYSEEQKFRYSYQSRLFDYFSNLTY